ncbi:MAG: UDP-N-acetylmuramoyl-L-alanine--D-glutamate ligase [Chloroflexi bacterium]|nr:UDP-N-acetylmuramoyl-L-alanine--D-glutamate ligase [Chloroflexota bacterium]
MDLKGKRATVIGLGREGVAVVRYLAAQGAQITVSDVRPAGELAQSLRQIEGLPVRLSLGENRVEDAVDAEIIYISPGVPLDIPCISAAAGKGVPRSSLTKLFFELCPAPIVGITGSSGKTTTTSLVGEILRAAGKHVFVGGNIGITLLERLNEIRPNSWVVLEVSSFQLETMDRSPHVAAITNITPNHLDWHPSMEEYIEAKGNILKFQSGIDFAVLNYDDPTTRELAEECEANVIFVSRTQRPEGHGSFISKGQVVVRWGGVERPVCATADIKLLGQHNLENVLVACAVCSACDVDEQAMRAVVTTFRGVEHRLEPVARVDGVDYYNDSIATTPERTVAGLRSFNRPVVLLAGGRDKHLPVEPLAETVWAKCKGIILFGEAASLLEDAIIRAPHDTARSLDIRRASSLAEAVALGAEMAASGDVVLLSPACTSFDLFVDFEQRGREFKRLVRELQQQRQEARR